MDRDAVREKSLARYKQERDWFALLREGTKALPGEEGRLQEKLLTILLDSKETVVDCVENEKPFIAGYFCNAPELFHAMDLPWYMLMETPFLAATAPYLASDIEGSENMGIGTDLCTAIRLPIYYIENGLMPVPSAVLGLLYPCDGAPMLHQVLEHNKAWQDVPIYGCDPPYTSDERAVEYFADELRRMADFLQKHTGKTLDMKKLALVCEESNRSYTLWQEYNELRRNVPCPHGWEIGGAQAFAISQCFVAGDPRCTDWFRQLYKCGELKVREGKGASETEGWKERIRLFWFDIMPYGWIFELMPWLEEEWGAVIVMDMFSNFPYTLIDTSSEKTIFHGLAKRNLLDYKIDCVIWPGHMGHKDGAATVGIMRETCRDLAVPFLHIGLDLFDRSYTKPEEVRDKVSEYFRGMGLG
jgi:hypothetical protein